MARTKTTNRLNKPGPITWTRFHQPPEREWPPAWPFSGTGSADDLHLGPLAGVTGVEHAWIGRMVDSPEEAVYIVQWEGKREQKERYVDLEGFWGSHACAEFLDNLPEPKSGVHTILSMLSERLPSLEDSRKVTEKYHAYFRRRFLVLEHKAGHRYNDMRGRVTLTAFLAPTREKAGVEGDDSSKSEPYESIMEFFKDTVMLPEYDQGMWWHHTTWWQGPAVSVPVKAGDVENEGKKLGALQRLERYLLGTFDGGDNAEASKVDDQTKDGGSEVVICEFHLWKTARSSNSRLEEKASKDVEAREYWDEVVKEKENEGLMKAWKKERWDIRSVPDSNYDPIEEQEYGHSECEE
ncbi:hypothetical protein QBC37DRAFT_429632 [Rhypophila decipiens]|uniref:ABM domain-containing protein n=1 Tax=Rhypophila decipiens TaxID=261697 RepID=A0AAN7B3U8_9PEZI|nr:hypothetical protein QBC37DRAFT_429632 [Rhypophila decipiens]